MRLTGLLCPSGSKRDSVNYAIPFQSSIRLAIDVSKQLGLGEIARSVREFATSKFEILTVKPLNFSRTASGTFPHEDFRNISVVIRDVHAICLYEVSTQKIRDCSACGR
jgi:hypothetical protein